MPYPVLFNPEAMELMAESLAEEARELRLKAMKVAIDCKMPLIKYLLFLRIKCSAPCHRWRLWG